MVRRAEWCIAALLLSLARLNGALAAAQSGAAHRELLQFDVAVPGEVNGVVTGVANLVSDVVDAFTAGLRFPNGNTPATTAPSPTAAGSQASSSPQPTQAPETVTPAPATTEPVTTAPATTARETVAPVTTAPITTAPVTPETVPVSSATYTPTPVPSETVSEPSPVAGTEALAAAETETPAPSAGDAGSQTTEAPATSSLETEAEITDAATPTATSVSETSSSSDNAIDSPDASSSSSSAAGSSSGSGSSSNTKSPRRKQSDVISNSNPDGSSESEPSLEDNVIPATDISTESATPSTTTAPPTAAPPTTAPPTTAPPTTAPATAPPASPSLAPVSSAASTADTAAQMPATTAPAKNIKPTTAPSDAGQVHAASYSGSLSRAVSGVGKNSTEPASRPPRKPRKSDKAAESGSQAQSETVESSNTSSGGVYSLGTSSILSIIGVIVGICATIALFVFISRKKYGEESDDELPMAYGYRIDGGSGVVRLSPTFLQNGENSMVGGRPPNNYDQDNTSSSGESGEEKVPYFGNSFGFDNYQAQSLIAGGGAMVAADLKPSERFSSIYSSMASENSESWSSVMESECDQSTTSRCTRDTTLSALTTPQNSESDRGTGSTRRPTDNSRSTYGEDMSDSSSNYRSTRASSHMSFDRDTSREGYDSYSQVSLDASQAKSSVGGGTPVAGLGASAMRSTSGTSFYRSSSIARSTSYSDFGGDTRSTDASSIYSVGSPSPFDV